MSRGSVKTFFPVTRLSELAARPGGISRSDAIAGAQKCIESLRAEGDEILGRSLTELETIVYGTKGKDLSQEEVLKVLRLADQLVTLSGTFGYTALDTVVRSLCDLTDGMLNTNRGDFAPIAVHVQSMRLLAPGSPTLPEGGVEKISEELAKVLSHYNYGSLDPSSGADDGEIAASPKS
jgi:hypothetical protein